VHIATPKEDKTLERAFSDWARTGQENADVVQLRAQGEGTGPAGGYLVPATMVNRLTERMKAFGGLEGVADVMTTTSGEVLNWPSLDDTSNEGEVVAEGAAPAGGADLVFGKRELGAYRFTSTGTGANPIRVSSELLMDNKFDVEGRIMNKLGERIARHAAPLFVRGNGVGQPEGIVNGCTSANGRAIELENDTNGLTYDDLINFEHSVDPAYRNMGNCSWAFNDASLKVIKKLQDSNGDPLWLPVTNDRLAANIFNGLLLGYPVLIDQGFVDLDVDDITDMWGVFGDIKEGLVIRKVSSIVVIRDPFTRKNEWEVEFVAHQRMDSIQNDKNAYVALTGEA
jgi:HK97 family phage major capsid protein